MSLPAVLKAWETYVSAAIGEAQGVAPDRAFRYAGKPPDDCCTDAGTLGVWWQAVDPTVNFPQPLILSGQFGDVLQRVDLGARLAKCWHVPESSDITAPKTVDRWDADAAQLAAITEHVNLALVKLSCGAARLDLDAVCGGYRWLSTRHDISGDCTGIEWHLYAALAGFEGT